MLTIHVKAKQNKRYFHSSARIELDTTGRNFSCEGPLNDIHYDFCVNGTEPVATNHDEFSTNSPGIFQDTTAYHL